MRGAAEHLPPAATPLPSSSDAPAVPAPRPRRGLFRKYMLALVGLVAAALIVNAGLEFWFSYRESKAALLALQQEKADAAAQRIGAFVTGIERQMGWTTLPLWSAAPLEQRQFDFVRLLRQVPAITELTELDGAGREQLKVSRIAMDVVGSGKDYSQAPEFTEARAHGTWFGPVYFRKQSEPYMTLALAGAGPNAGVTVASINLKLIWDIVTGLKIGMGGYAYVVDSHGKLIAAPDISLVLRDTDVSHLPQVAAALASRSPDGTQRPTSPVTIADNFDGHPALSTHARIKPLGWRVFVEVPLREAYAPLYALALRDALWLVLALAGAALAALLLARRMTGPIRLLQEGAARIGGGDLDRRIAVDTGDELEGLAGQFNRMAGDLQKSYAELEQRVRDRTAELSEALEQQTATAEVLQVINASPGNLAPVFDAMLEKAARLCNAPFGQLATYDGEMFRFVAAHGEKHFALNLQRVLHPPSDGITWLRIIGGEDVVHIPDARETDLYRDRHQQTREFVENGGGRALLSVALRKDDALLGILSIYRQKPRPFTGKEIALLQNFAAQAVIAMENARLLTETREALAQQTATAEVLQVINSSPGDLPPVFDAMLEKALQLCGAPFGNLLTFDGERFTVAAAIHADRAVREQYISRTPFVAVPGSNLERVVAGEPIVVIEDLLENRAYQTNPTFRGLVQSGSYRSLLSIALRKEGILLGVIGIFRDTVGPFSDNEIALLQNFAAQAVIAMENARLLGELRQRTEEVAELNRGLEARVVEQVEELGRVGRLKRFLAPQLAEMIVSQGDEQILESHRREIVVVFCDLRGYTAFTETAEPEEVLDFLREYHGALGPLVSQFEGTLDQFSGDGIMVFFNDPVPIPDPADRAVKMAVAMRDAASALTTAWRQRGRELGFGAGIAQGYATLGQIGFSERSGYTAIGTVCNVAARLCADATDGQILLSQRVHAALNGRIATEQVGALPLKGLTQPVVAYNVPLAGGPSALRVIEGGAPSP